MKNARLSFPVRVLFKWPGIVLLILAFAATGLLLSLLPQSAKARRGVQARVTSFFSRLALALFGVRVHVKHRERLGSGQTGRLVIANHLSYVDILVLAALSPMIFVTSVEMRHTPLLGRIAAWGGSLFVERRRPAGLKQEIGEIASVLSEGASVALFPEGTTSSGERVHPFKRSLFDAAVAVKADILPVCLRYTAINGEAVTKENRDALFFYGGTPFSAHFPRFLGLRSIDVELTLLKTIKVRPDDSRKELAVLGHECISNTYLS